MVNMTDETSGLDLTVDKSDLEDPHHTGEVFGAVLYINGTPHHLEFIRVIESDGIQVGDGPVAEGEFDTLDRSYDGDAPFQTVTVNDREYVAHVVPFR